MMMSFAQLGFELSDLEVSGVEARSGARGRHPSEGLLGSISGAGPRFDSGASRKLSDVNLPGRRTVSQPEVGTG